jgi:hypothetical protein
MLEIILQVGFSALGLGSLELNIYEASHYI